MTVFIPAAYTLPVGDFDLKHSRIGHALNWYEGGTANPDTTATGFFADAPLNTFTYEKWKPNNVNVQGWEYDHGSAVEVDYCAIGSHNMGTSGNRLRLQYFDDGSQTWEFIFLFQVVPDDSAVFCIFEPITAQRFRIQIDSGVPPEIGVIKFGKAMQMARPLFGGHTPLSLSPVVEFRTNETETGAFAGRSIKRRYFSTAFEWQNLPQAWVDANWYDFQEAVIEDPFFIAWRPEDRQDVGYCIVSQPPAATNMGVRDLMQVSMEVKAFVA